MNKVPEKQDLWRTSHPMSFEVQACVNPIIIAKKTISIEELRERMQSRGAYMMRVEEHQDERIWKILFLLDVQFYCELEIASPGGIPEPVREIFALERERVASETTFSDPLVTRDSRVKIIEKRTETLLRDGEKTDSQSEDEAEEERLAKEEREAKDATFQLKGVDGYILSFRFYTGQTQ